MEPHMAAISGKRATDERVTCLRIFADANGESHMEDVDIVLQPKQLFKDGRALRLTDNFPASWYNICYVPSGMSDGHIRRLPAGSVVLAEDTTGKGHISRHPPEDQLVVHVAPAERQS